MKSSHSPVVKDLVLVGGGHSHVTVLKRFGMNPLSGVRLTLICRDLHTPYSGMLPGFVAGHYTFDEAHIDLGPLARFAQARLYHDEVVGVDLDKRLLYCRRRPAVPYDLVSVNIGSTPSMSDVRGSTDSVIPVKPINQFVARWERLRRSVRESERPMSIAVVGAGAGGVELTLAVQFALCRARDASERQFPEPQFHLFSGSGEVLPTHNEKARATFRRVLQERGVRVHSGQKVVETGGGVVQLEDGSRINADEVLWVTQAGAASWLREAGLDVDNRGFVQVADTLQSTSHPEVFAAGDIATMVRHPREKAGVFAVRQGKPLEVNLRRALQGRSLQPFTPQKKFLSLISTGNQCAVASRGGWSLSGGVIWKWKDWIDRRFMDKYNVLPEMNTELLVDVPGGVASEEARRELSTAVIRCGGCGAKVGATVLSRVLQRLAPKSRKDILIGLDAPDDAAVVSVPSGKAIVQTVDSFRAIVEDPYTFAKITANHCLNDLFAMGAEPQSALAIVTVPYGIEAKVEETIEQLLTGAIEVLNSVNASLVGGHTSEGAELSLGLSLTGLIDPTLVMSKGGMVPGDRLILTKPLGTGTLFAADMRLKAKGRWIAAAIDSMLFSNASAADCLRTHGATACTDVTGFGLLGHLIEMTKASATDARITLAEVPLLDGALETSGRGILSSLQPQNQRLRRGIRDVERVSSDPCYPLLFDPQTAGGLLASVPAADAERCVENLRELGHEHTRIIGEVMPRGDAPEPVTIELDEIPRRAPASR